MTTLEDAGEEEGRALLGSRGAGQVGEGAGSIAGRPGRSAQAVHQNRPGNRVERGDDRASRARQEPSPARSGVDEHPQRDSVENGVDRGDRACSDRGPS